MLVSRLELAGVELATIKDDPLDQALIRRQLHLDVVNRPRAINRLDVENRQFVLLEILDVEWVLQRDLDDRRFRPENRVEQADQGDAVLPRAECLLEGEIVDRSDSKRHGVGGNGQVLWAVPESMHYTRSAGVWS